MKADELQVGNTILENGKEVVVTPEILRYLIDTNGSSTFQPIILTESNLNQFGFNKIDCSGTVWASFRDKNDLGVELSSIHRSNILTIRDKNWRLILKCHKVYSVHKLQQLYKIAGVEI